MAITEDIWKNRVLNAEALGEGEKKLYCEIEPILNELLDELKAKGKIKVSFTTDGQQHLKSILDNVEQVSVNHNILIALFDEPICSKFLTANNEFGVKERNLVNLYIHTGILLCVTTTEVFKALLLYHTKGVSRKVSKFCETMQQFAPTAWAKLKPHVDNKFRNALAHGTWALENKQVVIFDDAELIPDDPIELKDFMLRIKKQNVLFICLYNVLAERKQANFFT